MNAVVASGETAAAFAAGFDTAWIDFTKGLGAPVGAVPGRLAGADRRGLALQADARRRAAPGRDRGRGRRCTRSTTTSSGWPRTTPTRARWPTGLAEIDGVAIDADAVETNIVIFDVADAATASSRGSRSPGSR